MKARWCNGTVNQSEQRNGRAMYRRVWQGLFRAKLINAKAKQSYVSLGTAGANPIAMAKGLI
jgi:hypothetical protein